MLHGEWEYSMRGGSTHVEWEFSWGLEVLNGECTYSI